MSFLRVAPYLALETRVVGDVLRVSSSYREEWFVERLRFDLAKSAGLTPPWLPRLGSESTSAAFQLPARGVTLGALWQNLSVDEQALVMVKLLQTLTRAWPVSFPRSGVLCGVDGLMWLVPPFSTLVDGAAKTWDDFQFDEYCIGGVNRELTHSLAITLQRLLVRVPWLEFFALRNIAPQPPSSKVARLRPLDELVAVANDELWNKRSARRETEQRWISTLAVLEDQCQQSTASLAELVAREFDRVDAESRWG